MINIFLGKGYALQKNILYKDNESAINMEKNSRHSCTGNSRKIYTRYILLRIAWKRRSLVLSTVSHRRCLPTFSLNHCKGHFFGVSGKSLWDGRTSTYCKITSHPQRRSALKIMSLETSHKLSKRQLTPRL